MQSRESRLLLRRALRTTCLVVIVVLPIPASAGIAATSTEFFWVRIPFKVDLVDILWLLLLRLRRWQDVADFLNSSFIPEPAVFGKLNLDNEVQITLGVTALHWHAFAGDLEHLTRSQNLSFGLLDVQLNATTVQMCENDAVETCESFRKTDVQIGLQICACPVKDIVGCFVDHEDDISRLLVWFLVCFVGEDNPVALTCTAGNVKLDNVLCLALFAAVLFGYDFAGSLASSTRHGFLCYQSRAYLSENILLTCHLLACTSFKTIEAAYPALHTGCIDVPLRPLFHRSPCTCRTQSAWSL